MADREKQRQLSQQQSAWKKFHERHSRSEHSKHDLLYALPKRLIRVLQSAAPGLLMADDVAFENDLRKYGITAFVRRKQVLADLLDSRFLYADSSSGSGRVLIPDENEFDVMSIPGLEDRVRRAQTQQFRDVLSADVFDDEVRVKERQLKRDLDEAIQLRAMGYVGWLVTNPRYRWEVTCLRDMKEKWGRTTRNDTVASSSKPNSVYKLQSLALHAKWAISGLTTWDIPEPLEPSLFPGAPIPKNDISPSGVSMFLPWPFFIDQTIEYRQLVEFYQARNDLSHLAGWLKAKDRWGYARYARLLEMFVYLELALKQRYPERVKGRLEQIDLAFAMYWEADGATASKREAQLDSARKIRQKLGQRLRQCNRMLSDRTEQMTDEDKEQTAKKFFKPGSQPLDTR